MDSRKDDGPAQGRAAITSFSVSITRRQMLSERERSPTDRIRRLWSTHARLTGGVAVLDRVDLQLQAVGPSRPDRQPQPLPRACRRSGRPRTARAARRGQTRGPPGNALTIERTGGRS